MIWVSECEGGVAKVHEVVYGFPPSLLEGKVIGVICEDDHLRFLDLFVANSVYSTYYRRYQLQRLIR